MARNRIELCGMSGLTPTQAWALYKALCIALELKDGSPFGDHLDPKERNAAMQAKEKMKLAMQCSRPMQEWLSAREWE